MAQSPIKKIVSELADAAAEPGKWPAVLQSMADALGAVGAAYIAANQRSGSIAWASFCGPVNPHASDYVKHYGAVDPFRPLVSAGGRSGWRKLSQCLPDATLRASEWYQDFILPRGVTDILGVRLHHSSSHSVVLGIQYGPGRSPPAVTDPGLRALLSPLEQAARSGLAAHTSGLKATIGAWSITHLTEAMFVADRHGRVVEMNRAAESVVIAGNRLTIRGGKLIARDPAEEERLAILIASASPADPAKAMRGSMLIGRSASPPGHILTVFPLTDRPALYESALVMIQVVDPLGGAVATERLADLFGLSAAEIRLAGMLVQGRTLREMTGDFGVQMTTLRTQLRSLMRKCGVGRQVDLVRLLLAAK